MTSQTRCRFDRCPACGRRQPRNTEQNRRYWKLIETVAQEYHPDGQQFSAKAWHIQCRKQWLGCDIARLPDGSEIEIPRSTTDLDVDEFSDYMTQVEAWANSRGVFLED